MTLSRTSLDQLERAVRALATQALDAQSRLDIQTKSDGSPVTQVDLSISRDLIGLIGSLFPDCALISEEHVTALKSGAPYTFVVDPIDGTDVYSQGFPSWCVSVGILDGRHVPVGAMIAAPRFGISTDKGLFVRLDPGGPLLVNGEPFVLRTRKDELGEIMMGSDAIKHLSVGAFHGKIRCYGSTVLHLLCPVLVDKVHAAIQTVGYIWDFASSHAVLRSQGMDIWRLDGQPLTYDAEILGRKQIREVLYACTETCAFRLREVVRPEATR